MTTTKHYVLNLNKTTICKISTNKSTKGFTCSEKFGPKSDCGRTV